MNGAETTTPPPGAGVPVMPEEHSLPRTAISICRGPRGPDRRAGGDSKKRELMSDSTSTPGEPMDPGPSDLGPDRAVSRKVEFPDGPNRTTVEPASVLEDDDGEAKVPGLRKAKSSGGFGRRVAGLLALVFGLAGVLLSLGAVIVSIGLGISAGDTAARLTTPIELIIDRLEARVDETDDLITRSGEAAGGKAELGARVDGLVDLTMAGTQAFETIDRHPLYGRLPVDRSGLGNLLSDFAAQAETIDSELGSAGTAGLTAANAATMSDALDMMQADVTPSRSSLESTGTSLTNWTRLVSVAGVVLGLWSAWAQSWLARRGWRGMRGVEP